MGKLRRLLGLSGPLLLCVLWLLPFALLVASVADAAPLQRRFSSLPPRGRRPSAWRRPTGRLDAPQPAIVLLLLDIRGGSAGDEHLSDGEEEDDSTVEEERFPPIDDEDNEARDNKWFDGESSNTERDLRGGDIDDTNGTNAGDEDEAAIEALWEDEDEDDDEHDFADGNAGDIIEQTDPVDHMPVTGGVEPQRAVLEEEETPSFAAEAVLDNPAIDDNDSSTYVDRLDLADAYDDALDTDTNTDTADASSAGGALEATRESATAPAPTGDIGVPNDGSAAALAAAAASAPPSGAEIDAATKRTLTRDLGYRARDVDALKPDVAAVIAAHALHRPAEGVPAHWRRRSPPAAAANATTTTPPPRRDRRIRTLLPKIVIPALVGALVVTKGPLLWATLTAARGMSPRKPDRRPVGEAAVGAAEPSPTATTPPIIDDPQKQLDLRPEQPQPAVSGAGELPARRAPPGQRPALAALDVTWLDKLITAAERRVKAIFRWKIR